ncbi:hypothetical protein [Lederbergia graminis]|uniref:DUF3604 domain-containing protein n=1 Tax=Lederbergia graminis TaxID=735518 RepID=A0ABW0LKH5_9BACI
MKLSKYQILFTDLHSNVHHEHVEDLDTWYQQAKELLDFWAIAYYPYYMRKHESGMPVEDIYPMETVLDDWEKIKKFLRLQEDANFPVFLGYEWQGACLDGDHNVFFKEDGDFYNPRRYRELCELLPPDAIAIPHHLAYSLGHRGKNWSTHDCKRSPFAEIYSSHGSSESGYTDIHMNRHIHMGPRTGGTSIMDGLKAGHEIGIIASGDNHVVPATFGHGYAAVLAKNNSKEEIWDAFIKRRVYGVSHNKILLNYEINGHSMGESFETTEDEFTHEVQVEAGDAVSRIELIKDGIVYKTYVHNGKWENQPSEQIVTFKFKIEHGWGPDTRIFPDITSKLWHGKIKTEGEIVSVEKCWTSPGQKLISLTNKELEYELTSYKSTQTGKWMGPSPVLTEGFIVEIRAPLHSTVELEIDGNTYKKKVAELLDNTDLFVLYEEAKALLKDRFGFTDYYRSDPFYHNAYKVRLLKGTSESGYKVNWKFNLKQEEKKSFYFIKVTQRDGATAWSSPIWITKK